MSTNTHETDDLAAARAVIVQKLSSWVAEDPDQEMLGFAGAGGPLTRREILKEVREGTEFGEMLVRHWHKLALEHILDAALTNS